MTSFNTSRSTRRHLLRRCVFLSWLIVLPVLSGCNYVVLAAYLLHGPPSIEPDFEAMTKQSMTDHGVTVAVVCYAPLELKWDFEKIDQQVAQYVSFRLRDKHVQVVSPDRVQAWLDQNPNWDRPEEIGEHFGATYVVYIDLHKYSLYEPNSANLYRGRAEAVVSVVEMDDQGEGQRIYSKEIISKYPLQAPRATSEANFGQFEREYLSRLSEEIGRLFYEHYHGEDISDAT